MVLYGELERTLIDDAVPTWVSAGEINSFFNQIPFQASVGAITYMEGS